VAVFFFVSSAAALVLLGVISSTGDHPAGGAGAAGAAGAAAAVAADTGGGSGVTLVAADYVGHPVDDVAGQLAGLGLTVQRQQDPTSAVAPNTVTRIDPVGVVLHKGDPVRVSYAVPLGYAPASTRAPRIEVSTRSTTDAPAVSTSEAPVTQEQTQADTSSPTPTRTTRTTRTSASPTASDPSTESSSESSSSSSPESSASTSTPSGGGND
jgi:eukaryotic-like serine/threonine-protein kinase